MRRALASLLLVGALSPVRTADSADAPGEGSIGLLEVEFQLRALKTMRDTLGFFVPGTFAQPFVDEQQRLAAELAAHASQDLDAIETWTQEVVEAKEVEEHVLVRAIKDWAIGQARDSVKDDEGDEGFLVAWQKKKAELAAAETKSKSKTAALTLYLEELSSRPHLLESGTKADEGWRESVLEVYRGALKDRTNLHQGVVALEKQRLRAEAMLGGLRLIDKSISRYQKATEFLESPKDVLFDEAKEQLLERLKKRYGEAEFDATKQAFDVGKQLFDTAWATWEQVEGLDVNKELRGYPDAQRMAKRFAILGGAYKGALDALKALPVSKPLTPVLDALDLYGEMIGLVPTAAEKIASLYAKAAQQVVPQDAKWNPVRDARAKAVNLFQAELLEKAGIDVAYGDDDGNLFFLLVEKSVVPRGFATLSREQYDRLADALAAERILNAPIEAWGGLEKDAWGAVFGTENPDPLSEKAKKDAFKAFASETSPLRSKLTDADRYALARGDAVRIDGISLSAEQLVGRAHERVRSLAEQLIVRESLGEYSHDLRKHWWAFRDAVRSSGVRLSSRQLMTLFQVHRQAPTSVKQTLDTVARRQAAAALGIPRVGVPLVTIPSADDARVNVVDERRRAGTVEAAVFVSDLAADRKVAADLIWRLPDWAGGEQPPVQVTLGNGLTTFSKSIKVPESVRDKKFIVGATVSIAPDETHADPIHASGVAWIRIKRGSKVSVSNAVWKDLKTFKGGSVRLFFAEVSNDGQVPLGNPFLILSPKGAAPEPLPRLNGLTILPLLPERTATISLRLQPGPADYDYRFDNLGAVETAPTAGQVEISRIRLLSTYDGEFEPCLPAAAAVCEIKNTTSSAIHDSVNVVATYYDGNGKIVGTAVVGDSVDIPPGEIYTYLREARCPLIGDAATVRVDASVGSKYVATRKFKLPRLKATFVGYDPGAKPDDAIQIRNDGEKTVWLTAVAVGGGGAGEIYDELQTKGTRAPAAPGETRGFANRLGARLGSARLLGGCWIHLE